MNNHLRQQRIAERNETTRILAELSAELVPYRREVTHNAYIIGKPDFINAKVRLGKGLKTVAPRINRANHAVSKQARHPLSNSEKAVVNGVAIGEEYRAIVITEPNTGGKAVTPKTLGLLQLVDQAELPTPVKEESKMGIFTEVFTDIGDEQSIEQSLSTFSLHTTSIVSVLKRVDHQNLVLFDELGTGTDPQGRAALAIAISDSLGAKEVYVVTATHYPELKVYGYSRAGTISASMELDIDTLGPTYCLLIGMPGRSNAFEVSKRLGLDNGIVEAVRRITDGEGQDLSEMIEDLENRRRMTETEYLETRHYVDESAALHRELKGAYQVFFEEREKELQKARKEADKIIAEAEENAGATTSDTRKMQSGSGQQGGAEEYRLIDAKTRLSQLYHEEARLTKNKVPKKTKEQEKLKADDEVIVNTRGQRGTLLKDNGKGQWQAQLDILKMNVSEEDITPVTPQEEAKPRIITVHSAESGHVGTRPDLRGKCYEEALAEVDQYTDVAILVSYPRITIVHGEGTGALRTGATEFLKNHRNVKSYEFTPQNQGGNDATVVKFQ